MTRLIDADAYEHAVQGNPYVSDSMKTYVRCSIQSQPTVDAVQVIRCKDCKYNDAQQWVACTLIPQMFGKTADNNFCSYAEPKETT